MHVEVDVVVVVDVADTVVVVVVVIKYLKACHTRWGEGAK